MARLTYPKFQAPNLNGVNLAGGKVNFYISGTSTRKDTYSDEAMSVVNANPVILDARGEADIYGDGEYKVVLTDADDVEIWSEDTFYFDELRADLASTTNGKGASLVNFESGESVQDLASTATDDGTKGFHLVSYPPLTGEVGVVYPEYEYGMAERYGATFNGTDQTAEIQNCFDSAAALGVVARLPDGILLIDMNVTLKTGLIIKGSGKGITTIKRKDSSGIPLNGGIFNNKNFDIANAHTILDSNIQIEDLTLDGNKANNPAAHYGIFFTGMQRTTIRNVEVKNTTLQGIRILGSDQTKVLQCYCHDTDADPIHLEDAIDYEIDGNMVHDSLDYGIEVTSGTLAANGSTGRGTITNNKVDTCTNWGICVRGIKDATTNPSNNPITGARIIGNSVTGCTTGIVVQEYAQGIIIIGNESYGNTNGIGTVTSAGTSSSRVVISQNVCYSNTGNGLFLDTLTDSVISSNQIYDNAYNGITGSLGSCIINNNYIHDNCTSGVNVYSGIVLNYAEYSTISSNDIDNSNSLYAIAEVGGYCSHNKYVGNTMHGKALSHQGHFTLWDDVEGALVDGAMTRLSKHSGSIPTAVGSPGTIGEYAANSGYLYVCYATNSWGRVLLSAF